MSQVFFDTVREAPIAPIQLQAFLAKVTQDASLREKLKLASDPSGIAAVAKEAGFEFSAGDLAALTSSRAVSLSDQELEDIAGMPGAGCYQTCANNSRALT